MSKHLIWLFSIVSVVHCQDELLLRDVPSSYFSKFETLKIPKDRFETALKKVSCEKVNVRIDAWTEEAPIWGFAPFVRMKGVVDSDLYVYSDLMSSLGQFGHPFFGAICFYKLGVMDPWREILEGYIDLSPIHYQIRADGDKHFTVHCQRFGLVRGMRKSKRINLTVDIVGRDRWMQFSDEKGNPLAVTLLLDNIETKSADSLNLRVAGQVNAEIKNAFCRVMIARRKYANLPRIASAIGAFE